MTEPSWQVWASVAGAIAAWAAVAVMLFAEFRRRTERRVEMDQKYADLAASRETFWTALREAYARFHDSHPQAPEKLENLINAAGLPSDLVPRDGRDLFLWPTEHAHELGPDQRLLWGFSSQIYPPRENRQGRVTDFSLIARDQSETFHNARGDLARFWHTWVPSMKMNYLRERHASAKDQVILLTWLELALIQWTKDAGEGKMPLFRFAKELVG